MNEIIEDILKTYPECTSIKMCGSYARGEANPRSDLDIVIGFPKKLMHINFNLVCRDQELFDKWNRETIGICVDFIIHIAGSSFPGQHEYRRKKKMCSPAVILWRKGQ